MTIEFIHLEGGQRIGRPRKRKSLRGNHAKETEAVPCGDRAGFRLRDVIRLRVRRARKEG